MKRIFTIVAVVLLCTSFARAADPFADEQAKAAAANPKDVAFTISLPAATFHAGEPIPVNLSFSSTAAGKYKVDGGLYDRSGRMSEDAYLIDPVDGTVDPLKAFFENGAFMGGGIRQVPVLNEKPFTMRFELNEWIRFDRPGKYRLYVNSSRVQDAAGDGQQRLPRAASNLVTFEVLPADAEWSRQELAEIVKTLDTATDQAVIRAAARRLRFLGTRETAPELARRFNGSPCDWDYMLGLVGHPDLPAATDAVIAQIAQPDFPVTGMYVRAAALLKTMAEPRTRPAATTGPADMTAFYQAQRDRMTAATAKVFDQLLAALDAKQGRALAVSMLTLLETPESLNAEQRARLSAKFPAVFASLPLDRQCEALESRWSLVRSPAILPVLLEAYRNPAKDDSNSSDRQSMLRDACLRRAYELDPVKVRPMVLEAIAKPAGRFHRFSYKSLLRLPEATLPEMNDSFTARLNAGSGDIDFELTLNLIHRYGTADLLLAMREAYGDKTGRWACSIQASFIAYFLRVDPAYGIKCFQENLAARGDDHWQCCRRQFGDVSTLIWVPQLEPLAIDALTDPELEVIQSAAGALGQFASPAAKEKLFAALAAEWTAAPADPKQGYNVENPAERRETAIAGALLNAHGWELSDDELKRLDLLCHGEGIKQDIESYRTSRKGPIMIDLATYDGVELRARLFSLDFRTVEELGKKLQQFPPGTVFTLRSYQGDVADDAEPARIELRKWAKTHDVTIKG